MRCSDGLAEDFGIMQCTPCSDDEGSSPPQARGLQRSDRSRSDRRRSTPGEGGARVLRRVGVHSLRLSNVLFGQSETLDKYGAEYCDELTGDFGDPYASDASGAVACSESDSELDGLYFLESDG